MTARIGAGGAQVIQHDDLRFAAEITEATGQFDRVGARRHQRVFIAMKVQNPCSGLCQRSKVIDRVKLARASAEFLKLQAIIQSLGRTGDDIGQAWVSAEVSRWTDSRDPVNACGMAKCPTIRDEAAVAVRQDPRPLVQAMF